MATREQNALSLIRERGTIRKVEKRSYLNTAIHSRGRSSAQRSSHVLSPKSDKSIDSAQTQIHFSLSTQEEQTKEKSLCTILQTQMQYADPAHRQISKPREENTKFHIHVSPSPSTSSCDLISVSRFLCGA